MAAGSGRARLRSATLDFGDPRAYVMVMTLMEQEALLNSKGKPWASLKDSFAASRDLQIEAVHADPSIREEWRDAIEQAHRDNYERLIETLVKVSNRA